jgi:hypothetical protein
MAASHVVWAEFDIGSGATVRSWYPSKVEGEDDSHLASMMLPEGSHHRDKDWTLFMLRRQVWPPAARADCDVQHVAP